MTTSKVQLTFPTEGMTKAIESLRDSVIEDHPELLEELEGLDELYAETEEIISMALEIMSKHLNDEEILFLNELYSNPIILGIMDKYPAILKDAFEVGNRFAAEKMAVYNEANPL